MVVLEFGIAHHNNKDTQEEGSMRDREALKWLSHT